MNRFPSLRNTTFYNHRSPCFSPRFSHLLFAPLLVLYLVFITTVAPSFAAAPCGGAGQRACCVTERIPSCNPGLHEVLGCSGNCTCGGANPLGAFNSVGHCVPNAPPAVISACGGVGQRACCVTERVPSCNPGAHEVLGCSGNCICGGPNPAGALKAIGHCEANPVATPCGGVGQRACCVTERVPSCNPGAHEVLGCSGNCTCGGPNPAGALKAIGHCEANPVVTPCGGPGQRACCVTERIPSCNPGMKEVLGCSGNCTCGGPNPAGALKAIGHCVAQTCGGLGQRACCVTERVPSCDLGLLEVPGCTGDCKCGGANPLGALNAIGHCENGCTAAKSIVEKLERDLANAKNQLNNFCSQGAVVRPQPSQNLGGSAMPPSIQRQLAPQLLKR